MYVPDLKEKDLYCHLVVTIKALCCHYYTTFPEVCQLFINVL